QPVEGISQRLPPLLIPAAVPAGIASAIALPAFYAMTATPGGVGEDFHLVVRRIQGQKFAVVGEPGHPSLLNVVQCMSQRHLAEGVVMAVGLAVGGDADEFRPLPGGGKAARQAGGKYLAVIKQFFEGNRLGNGTVIKEQGNAPSRRKTCEIGPGRVDPPMGYLMPCCGAELSYLACLMRREDGVGYPRLCQSFERFQINRSFRQPHPF